MAELRAHGVDEPDQGSEGNRAPAWLMGGDPR